MDTMIAMVVLSKGSAKRWAVTAGPEAELVQRAEVQLEGSKGKLLMSWRAPLGATAVAEHVARAAKIAEQCTSPFKTMRSAYLYLGEIGMRVFV
jgi:hypothetical protein